MRQRFSIVGFLLLSLFLCTGVTGFKEEVVLGTIVGSDVVEDFGDAVVLVSPEKAQSRFGVFEQVVTVTNKGSTDLFYWFDPYYDESMNNIEVFDVSERVVSRDLFDTSCVTKLQSNGSFFETCTNELIGKTEETINEYTKLSDAIYTKWGGVHHYVQTKGVLVPAGSSHSWLVRFKPRSDAGKWNARIWADESNDWTCIEDDKLTCVYSYTIDPTWDRNPSTYGVLAAYTFDNNVTSGTVLTDSHGKYNATLVNGVQSNQTGKINEAYLYDGSNDFVAVNAGGTISSFNSFSMWFLPNKTITTSANLQGILSKSNLSITTWQLGGSWSGSFSDEIVTISPDETGNKAYYWTATGLGIASFPSGNWQHIVITWSSNDSNYRLYLNGTDKGLATQFGSPAQVTSLTNLNIGRGYDIEFNGTIDELTLWNNSLNDSEVTSLYDGGAGFQYPYNTSTPASDYVDLNTSFPDEVYETSTNQFNFTFNFNNNTNVTSVNVTYNNTLFSASFLDGNITQSRYAINITSPLIEINNTGVNFNVTYYIRFENGTNTSNTSTTQAHTLDWAFYPASINGDAEIYETDTITIESNITKQINTTEVSFLATLQWNVTNQSTSTYSNDSNTAIFEYSVTVPLVEALTTAQLSAYLNVSFNGTTYNRTLLNDTLQTINLAYFPIMILSDATVLESSTQTIPHNVSRLVTASNVSFTSTLQWNATNYTNTTMTNDTASMIFNHYVSVPAVASNQTVNISSWLTITFGASTVTRTNSTIYTNQTVVAADFGECAEGQQQFLNFTIYNEENDSVMIADLNGHFWVTPESTGITEELNLTFTGDYTYALCFIPENETITVTAQIEYESLTEFPTKTYYITDDNLTNDTTFIDLYLTPNSTQVALNVVDQDDSPISNATIYVLSYDLGTDSYVISEIVRTDFAGTAYSQLTLFTQFYRFMIFIDEELVLSTLETKVITTSLTFRINVEDDYFTNYDIVKGIACNVSYDSGTNIFTYDFLNTAGESVDANLTVTEYTMYGDNVINSSTTSGVTGSLTVYIGTPLNATYIASGTIILDNELFVCNIMTQSFGFNDTLFGLNGILLTFMIVVVLAMVGLWSPIASVALSLLGLVISVVFGFFFIQMGTLIVVILMGVISMWRLNRR